MWTVIGVVVVVAALYAWVSKKRCPDDDCDFLSERGLHGRREWWS